MGWWNASILGGDEPLDYLADFEEMADVADLYPLENAEVAALETLRLFLNDNLAALVADAVTDESPIHAQVLAVLVLASGAFLDEASMESLTAAAWRDEWATRDEDRLNEIVRLVTALRAYDGTANVWEHPGLFASVAGGPFDG